MYPWAFPAHNAVSWESISRNDALHQLYNLSHVKTHTNEKLARLEIPFWKDSSGRFSKLWEICQRMNFHQKTFSLIKWQKSNLKQVTLQNFYFPILKCKSLAGVGGYLYPAPVSTASLSSSPCIVKQAHTLVPSADHLCHPSWHTEKNTLCLKKQHLNLSATHAQDC